MIFDTHFHIIDHRFPINENNGFIPGEFKLAEYLHWTDILDIRGGVIIPGSYHGFDNAHIIQSIKEIGNDYIGIAQLKSNVSDDVLFALDRAGIRGLRFNVKRGIYSDPREMLSFAQRVYELLKWHVEIYPGPGFIDDNLTILTKFPSLSIDHLGVSSDNFSALLRLVQKGVMVKASGFGRVDFDVRKALKQVVDVNPVSLMFGTDLPSTRTFSSFRPENILMIKNIFDDETSDRILYKNALSFYRMARFTDSLQHVK